jgi:hypothetical protein
MVASSIVLSTNATPRAVQSSYAKLFRENRERAWRTVELSYTRKTRPHFFYLNQSAIWQHNNCLPRISPRYDCAASMSLRENRQGTWAQPAGALTSLETIREF